MRYYQVQYRGHTLSISEEDLSFLPRSANWSENLYTVEGAVEADIQTLNSLDIKSRDINHVADELTAIWFDLDTAGCVWEEIVDLEEAEVVYDPASNKFLAVSDIDTEPVYMYWNGHEFRYVWLPEPDHFVETGEDPDLTIMGESTDVYQIAVLDGKPSENQFYLREFSQGELMQPEGRIISSQELDKLIEWARNRSYEEKKEEGKIIAKWSGRYPTLCYGEWSISVNGEDVSGFIPEELKTSPMGTEWVYRRWHKTWDEKCEAYVDGLECDEWVQVNKYWLDRITTDAKIQEEIFYAIQQEDFRYGSCGGCI